MARSIWGKTYSKSSRQSSATGAPGDGGLALLGVRMASLPAEENGTLNTSSRPCDTNSLFKLDSKSTNIAVRTGPSRRQCRKIASGPAKPIPCYAFGLDNRRNEFRNVEQFS